MPYNSHQDLPPYYSGGIGNSSSSSSSSSNLSSSNSSSNSSLNSTSASPPLLHHQQQHLHHHHQPHHQHQQQQAKLSSPESSSLSPLSSSSSSSSSLSAYPNMTSSMTGLFAETDDVDMQPLDLSVRSGRDEQVTKRPRLADHKPSCLVRSCVCNLGNTRAQRLSPYPLLAPGMARSPNPRMSSSPLSRTDSPFYTQRRTPSPAYYNGGICPSNGTSSLYHLPPPTQPTVTTTATEGSSFQILTTSDNVLNGISNHSGLFRPYDDHIDSDLSNMNANPPGEILQDQPPVVPSQPPQHAQQQEEDEEPTYMDLDSATPKSLYTKPHKDYSGSSSTICHEKSASEMATVQRGNSEGRTQTALTHNEPTVLPTSSGIASCDSSEMKTAMYYVGVGTSHSSSTEKVQNYQNGEASYLSNGMPTRADLNDHQQQDQHQMQPQHHAQQMYHPDSSSPTNGMSSSSGHMTTLSVYPNNPQPIRFPYSGGHLDQSDDLSPAGDARFPVVPATEQPHHYPQQQQPQHQSPAPGQAQLCQTSRKSPSNKETTSENKNKSFNSPPTKKTANYFQLPVTSTSPNDQVGLKNRRNGERRGSMSLHRPPSVSEGDNEDSTKISLLDFWISKILMERSASETPSSYKPCNVDYIRTVDGEKKIRLRLVDLIELQVEQSLKA